MRHLYDYSHNIIWPSLLIRTFYQLIGTILGLKLLQNCAKFFISDNC
ncbi:MAG: hypothetical protein M3Y76_02075 [Chloroflexota bacterium]|nr:hypothetical protein [Chloroflexota bacterium]